MSVSNPSPIQILDEGVSQGYVTRVDFVGSSIAATVSGITATVTTTAPATGSIIRVIATGATLTIADQYSLVLADYLSIEGTGILALQGDAALAVL